MVRKFRSLPIWDITSAVWVEYPSNKRFAICTHGAPSKPDDAIFDKETGLVWERSPQSTMQTWDSGIVTSYSKAVGGRKGWRLPTIEELLSLVDPSNNNPTLPSEHPFLNIQTDGFYWSCTLGMSTLPTYAWGYNFWNGDTSNVLKTSQAYVWLVRAAYGHDYPY